MTSISRSTPRWLTRQGLLVAALIVVAVAIRLPLMTFRGYYSDLATYVQWGDRAVRQLSTLYTASGGAGKGGFGFGGGQAVNYPPGMPYLFGLVVALFNALTHPTAQTSLDALMRSNGVGPFLAKLPILLADVGAVVLLYREAHQRRSERFALLVAASYALSPAVLYNGAVWGQTDGLVALPLLGALFALLAERYALGGVSLALAILLKPQPIIFVPLLLLYLWRWQARQHFWRFTGAGLATLLVFLVPVMVPNFQLGALVANIQAASYNANSAITSDAFNFWWVAGYGHQTLSATLFGLPGGLVGELLFGAVTLLVGIHIWRHREPLALCFGMAVQSFGFFLFMGGQHERYLFLFIPLMLACIILAPRPTPQPLVTLYLLGTALCLLNMVIGVGGGSFASSELIPFLSLPALSSVLAATFDTVGMLLAFAHCGAFGYALATYLRDPDAATDTTRADAEQPLGALTPETRQVVVRQNAVG